MSQQVVCTIITKSYLAFARVLSQTLTQHNPNAKLYVLLADSPDGYFEPANEPFDIIFLEDLLDQPLVKKMCFYYTPLELCCALRGMLHEYIYEKKIADSWIFLDSDILVFNSLEEIFDQLKTTSILLNPHIISPVAQKLVNPIELEVLASGIYNGGFLGLSRTEDTKKFIDWFKHRLAHYAFNRRGKESIGLLFLDQLWLNLVPHFFQGVSFLTHPGANAAYWSLHSHTVTKQADTFFVEGKPLLFTHMSCWDISQPEVIHKYLSIESITHYWGEWGNYYRKLLLENGYEECKKYPYSFDKFSSGRKILAAMRYLYYEKVFSAESLTMNPFANANYFTSQLNLQNSKATALKLMRKLSAIRKRLFWASSSGN